MKDRLQKIIVLTVFGLLSTVMPQNPPSLTDAPDQGPITGIAFVIVAGGIMFARKIRDQHQN